MRMGDFDNENASQMEITTKKAGLYASRISPAKACRIYL